jgi:hypothetical protein
MTKILPLLFGLSGYSQAQMISLRRGSPLARKSICGASKITLLVFLVIGYFVVTLGLKIGEFYYAYSDLQNEMVSVVQSVERTDREKMISQLKMKMLENRIPAPFSELRVNHEGNEAEVWLTYQEKLILELFGERYHLWTFPFHAYANSRKEGKTDRKIW